MGNTHKEEKNLTHLFWLYGPFVANPNSSAQERINCTKQIPGFSKSLRGQGC